LDIVVLVLVLGMVVEGIVRSGVLLLWGIELCGIELWGIDDCGIVEGIVDDVPVEPVVPVCADAMAGSDSAMAAAEMMRRIVLS
jgi:hypothetical protein